MSKPKIYLAGPIKSLSYGDATGWRDYATRLLNSQGMAGFSPMRSKHFLVDDLAISTGSEFYQHVVATPKAIVARDRYDVKSCDMMLINVAGAFTVSLGTAIEIGWADSFGKLMVMVRSPKSIDRLDYNSCRECGAMTDEVVTTNKPFSHEFIEGLVPYIVDTLEEAVLVCRSVLFAGDVEEL